jgi:2Fe-2S ferredoxin
MPTITYISPDGTRKEVEVENGYSVMEGAINNNIDGIVAECGGACACATCHSYIDEAWLDKIPPMDDMEDSMLDAAFERKPNSRLTCPTAWRTTPMPFLVMARHAALACALTSSKRSSSLPALATGNTQDRYRSPVSRRPITMR